LILKIFYAVLCSSLTCAVLAVAAGALSHLLRKKLPAAWHYYIWTAVLLFTLFPLNLPFDTATYTDPYEEYKQQLYEEKPFAIITSDGTRTVINTDTVQNDIPILTTVKTGISPLMPAFSVTWLIVSTLLLVFRVSAYIISFSALKKDSIPLSLSGLPAGIKAMQCKTVSSPFLAGALHPILFLPQRDFSKEELDNVILHELTHYKRHDTLIKWICLIAKCVHFFNPVIYYVCAKLDEECEIACDAALLKNMSDKQRTAYCNTILSLLSAHQPYNKALLTGMASDKKILKKRFLLMKTHKKPRKITVVLSVAATLAILLCGILIYTHLHKNVPYMPYASGIEATAYSGYIDSSDSAYIDIYAEEGDKLIMSIPKSVISSFPATDNIHGKLENISFYCGSNKNFLWAFAVSKPAMNASNINLCTSQDSGKNWHVDTRNNIRYGICDGAWFETDTKGFISFSETGGNGPALLRTLDGGNTWHTAPESGKVIGSEQAATELLKRQLITAYENTYGKYIPANQDPGNLSGDDLRLPYIIENLHVYKQDDEFYWVKVIWDFIVEKQTGAIYKVYNGIDPTVTPFDPNSDTALAFAG